MYSCSRFDTNKENEMAFQKKAKKDNQANKGKNILNSPEERKKFKSALATITHYFRQVDDANEGAKETIADLSAEYGLDKKVIRKMAKTMYNHNYGSMQEENRHFESLYEIIIEGKLREDPVDDMIVDASSPDEHNEDFSDVA